MASFTKYDGQWRVAVVGTQTREGDQVRVNKKDGSSRDVTVTKVLLVINGVSICEFKEGGENRPTGQRAATRRATSQVCAECGRPGRLVPDMEDGMLKHWNCCDMPPD